MTPALSITGTSVFRPAMSSNTSGSVDGCSSDRATRMPSIAVLRVGEDHALVERRERGDALDRPASCCRREKKNCVRSCIKVLPPGSTQSLSVTSSPRSAPDLAETMRRCTMVPIFGASCGLIASELFQKSMPLTLS